MTDINITRFYNNVLPITYSASVAEIGQDAGPTTWQAALDDAPDFNMLDTDDRRDAFREHVKGFGAWTDEEIAAWSDVELNALFIQMVAGDMREGNLPADDWSDYEARVEAGKCGGRIYRAHDGQIYYSL